MSSILARTHGDGWMYNGEQTNNEQVGIEQIGDYDKKRLKKPIYSQDR